MNELDLIVCVALGFFLAPIVGIIVFMAMFCGAISTGQRGKL